MGSVAEGATRSNTEARGAGLDGVVKRSAAEGGNNNYRHGQDNFQPLQEDNSTKDGIGDQMTSDQMTGDQMNVAGTAAITSRARTTPRSTSQDKYQPHQEDDTTKDGIVNEPGSYFEIQYSCNYPPPTPTSLPQEVNSFISLYPFTVLWYFLTYGNFLKY